MIYDYKYRPQPSMPDIFDEIFAPFVSEGKTYAGQTSKDGSIYTLAVEIPRLVRDTISVEIEEDLKSTSAYRQMGYSSYKIIIKAAQQLLLNYLDETQESAKKAYKQECTLEGHNVALDGDLGLSYTEGVLCIQIPLTKPTQPKKQALSARLSDIDTLA